MKRVRGAGAEAWLRALSLFLSALVVLAFTSGLRDTSAVWLVVPRVTAPPAPRVPEGRDARARIEVVTDGGAPAAGATVTMFSIADEQAYLVGARACDASGRATFVGVPRGEVWVLAEAPGRQRSSTRAVLLAEPKTLRLTLRPAQELAVSVVDEDGAAVVGATVEARGADPLPFLARTGDGGTVTFTRLGPPPWILRAHKVGLEVATKSGVGASPATLVLRALGTLVVKVKTPTGEPAEGATVLVGGPQLHPARSVQTNERGEARVPGLPRGVYQLSASVGTWASDTEIGVPLERGELKEVELQLGLGRKVTVRVTDGDGPDAPPIAGARVVLAEDLVTTFPREELTARDGTATLGPISNRPASLRVEADGFVPHGLLLPPVDKGPLQVPLVRGGKLIVQVDDDREMPVPGASIEIVGVDFAGMPVDETAGRARFRATHFTWALPGPQALLPAGELGVTVGPIPGIHASSGAEGARIPEVDASAEGAWISGRDGRFTSPPVPPGRLRAIVRHPGFVEAVSDVAHVASGGEARVKVTMRTGATLSGRVVDASGRGVAGARVEVSATRGSLVRSSLTADDGSFAFASVPALISLSVSRPESIDRVALTRALELGESEKRELVLTLPEARDSTPVRVLDDRRFPLDGVQLSVLSLSDESPLRATRFTDKEGLALIPDAAGLRARVTASLPGYATEVTTLDLTKQEVALTMRRGVSAVGDVRTRGGREPLDGVEIVAVAPSGTRRAKSDGFGRFELRDLSPGKLRLTLTKRGFGRVERVVVVPEADGDAKVELPRIVVEEAGSIEGEVVDARGDPVAGARVALDAAPAYLPIGPLPSGVAVTNARGQFVLADVAEGTVTLEAYSADHGRGRERTRARRGEIVRDVRIRLDEAVAGAEAATSGGVAITLGERQDDGARAFFVRHVAGGSEAERAGVEDDDVVLTVDGHAPTSLEDLRSRLSGPLGHDVTIVVSRQGVEHRLRVARERVRR